MVEFDVKLNRYKAEGTCVCSFRCFSVGWCFYKQVVMLFVYGNLLLLHVSGALEGKNECTWWAFFGEALRKSLRFRKSQVLIVDLCQCLFYQFGKGFLPLSFLKVWYGCIYVEVFLPFALKFCAWQHPGTIC